MTKCLGTRAIFPFPHQDLLGPGGSAHWVDELQPCPRFWRGTGPGGMGARTVYLLVSQSAVSQSPTLDPSIFSSLPSPQAFTYAIPLLTPCHCG